MEVTVKGSLDEAIRKLNWLIKRDGTLTKVERLQRGYEKPSQEKNRKKREAKKRKREQEKRRKRILKWRIENKKWSANR